MSRIVISTSSSCIHLLNIPHNIQTLPLHIAINNVDFMDGKNVNPTTLTRLILDYPATVAHTTPAAESEVIELLLNLYKQGYKDIFICCLSSQFSNSFDILTKAKHTLASQLNIYIYDTKTLNLDEGALAYEADYLLQQGKSFSEIAARLDEIRQNSTFLFTLYELDYIIKNKKLSAPAGFFANLFDIKPIMEITQAGKIVAKDKIRKIDKALSYLGKEICQFTQGKNAYIYLASGGYQQDVDYFAEILEKEYGLRNLPVIPVSTVSLANHGPRGVAIGAFTGNLPKIVELL